MSARTAAVLAAVLALPTAHASDMSPVPDWDRVAEILRECETRPTPGCAMLRQAVRGSIDLCEWLLGGGPGVPDERDPEHMSGCAELLGSPLPAMVGKARKVAAAPEE